MSPQDRQLLCTFAERVRARFPEAQVWAYGSRVRDEATWESDLDTGIVLDRPVTRAVKDWIGDVAWEVGFAADRLISTLVFERWDFEEGPLSASALVAAMLREGVPA